MQRKPAWRAKALWAAERQEVLCPPRALLPEAGSSCVKGGHVNLPVRTTGMLLGRGAGAPRLAPAMAPPPSRAVGRHGTERPAWRCSWSDECGHICPIWPSSCLEIGEGTRGQEQVLSRGSASASLAQGTRKGLSCPWRGQVGRASCGAQGMCVRMEKRGFLLTAGQGTPTACVPGAAGGGPAVFGASCVPRDRQSAQLHRKHLLNERTPEHTSPEQRRLQGREDGREGRAVQSPGVESARRRPRTEVPCVRVAGSNAAGGWVGDARPCGWTGHRCGTGTGHPRLFRDGLTR